MFKDWIAIGLVVLLGIFLLVLRHFARPCPRCGSDQRQPCRQCWEEWQW